MLGCFGTGRCGRHFLRCLGRSEPGRLVQRDGCEVQSQGQTDRSQE